MKLFFKKHQQTHTIDYLVLIGVLVLAVVTVNMLRLSDISVTVTTLFLSVVYFLWGVTHHKKAGHIDQKIMLEYLSFAILVNVLVYMLIS